MSLTDKAREAGIPPRPDHDFDVATARPLGPEPEPYRIEDTCCGKCYDALGGHCYVDQVTGA